jgi:hypothetical protein
MMGLLAAKAGTVAPSTAKAAAIAIGCLNIETNPYLYFWWMHVLVLPYQLWSSVDGSITSAELAAKPLRCSRCDHVQSFAPDMRKRRPSGRRARAVRHLSPPMMSTPDLPNDRLNDLWAG